MVRVLLVCTGNICRSPIAHGLLRDRSKSLSWEVRSSGTWARNGSGATPEAVSAAAQHGVDIQAHRSSRYAGELGSWADLIVTMTTEQVEEVLQESPEARVKTFTLKELVSILGALPPPAGTDRESVIQRIAEADRTRLEGHEMPLDLDVADPLGLSEMVYLAVAAELEALIDNLVRGLAKTANDGGSGDANRSIPAERNPARGRKGRQP